MQKIDLHGMKHQDVKAVLIRKIEDMWDSNEELHIITGHSDKMKKIVGEVLDEYKLEYTIGDFVNPGYIKTIV